MDPILDLFARWGVRQAGLFTFPHSPKHLGLYQKFGFWPQYLTPLVEKPVAATAETADGQEPSTYSTVSPREHIVYSAARSSEHKEDTHVTRREQSPWATLRRGDH
jgi:hypothetical protein